MRIIPNYSRLRLVAAACWIVSSWLLIYSNRVLGLVSLVVSVNLLTLLLFAVGVAFWLLGGDRHAGIILDSKGLLLNLGTSSAFIAWDNIERVGVCTRRESLLSLGSFHQLGIVLKDVQPYVQSYEERLPTTSGPLAWALRQIEALLRPFHQSSHISLAKRLAARRTRTGYDVLVSEAFLGATTNSFIVLVEDYRTHPAARRMLANFAPAR